MSFDLQTRKEVNLKYMFNMIYIQEFKIQSILCIYAYLHMHHVFSITVGIVGTLSIQDNRNWDTRNY
jgi:hypothetical protein